MAQRSVSFLFNDYLLKKSHQNPLSSFKDLCMHRDRQCEALCFIRDNDDDYFYYYVFNVKNVASGRK
jgi:hypothetical protein